MKGKFGMLSGAAVLAASLAMPALWAQDLPDQSLSDYKVGETLLGDEVKEKDLEGRVVVIEYWGTR